MDLRQGRYALICFSSDRQGGASHAAKGMVRVGDVEPASDDSSSKKKKAKKRRRS